MTHDIERVFICLSSGCPYVLFREVFLRVLCPFFNWIVCFFVVELYERYRLAPARMAIISKSTNKSWEDEEKRESSCTIGRNAIGAATVESSMEFPQKIKSGASL